MPVPEGLKLEARSLNQYPYIRTTTYSSSSSMSPSLSSHPPSPPIDSLFSAWDEEMYTGSETEMVWSTFTPVLVGGESEEISMGFSVGGDSEG